MSKTTKKKHVVKEVLETFTSPTENQQIVKVLGGRGNNLHEVESSSGEQYLVSMPSKFRKNVWIKRGDFVVVEPIEEGDKVKAEIVSVLFKEQIKQLKLDGLWPKEFTERDSPVSDCVKDQLDRAQESDCDDDLFVNTNRPAGNATRTDSSDSSEEGD